MGTPKRKRKVIGRPVKKASKRLAAKKSLAVSNKAKHSQVMMDLKPLAKEIDARLVLAVKAYGNGDDHRLAASLQLAKVKKRLDKAGINFKKWVVGEMEVNYNTARKLAQIGASPNPKEALTVIRNDERVRKVASRRAAKIEGPTPPSSGSTGPAPTPISRFDDLVDHLTEKKAMDYIDEIATTRGMKLVSKDDHKLIKANKPTKGKLRGNDGLIVAQNAFNALGPTDKMRLVKYAAGEVGVKLENAFGGDQHTDDAVEDNMAAYEKKNKITGMAKVTANAKKRRRGKK